jgi:hypothetical protein
LPNCIDNPGDLFVVLADAALELGKFLPQFAIRLESSAKFNERSHDRDIYLYRPRAIQNARKHGDALLGESVRACAPQASPT